MPNVNLKPRPEFSLEDDERRFWAEHDSTEFVDWAAASRGKLLNPKSAPRTMLLRLPVSMIQHLKVVANRLDVLYPSLLKVFRGRTLG